MDVSNKSDVKASGSGDKILYFLRMENIPSGEASCTTPISHFHMR